jgi:hypothetical protein
MNGNGHEPLVLIAGIAVAFGAGALIGATLPRVLSPIHFARTVKPVTQVRLPPSQAPVPIASAAPSPSPSQTPTPARRDPVGLARYTTCTPGETAPALLWGAGWQSGRTPQTWDDARQAWWYPKAACMHLSSDQWVCDDPTGAEA